MLRRLLTRALVLGISLALVSAARAAGTDANPSPVAQDPAKRDSDGRDSERVKRIVSRTRTSLVALGTIDKDQSADVHVDLSRKVRIPGQPLDGYLVMKGDDPLPVGYVATTAHGHFSAVYDSAGRFKGKPARLLNSTRHSLIALGGVSEQQRGSIRVDFSEQVPIPFSGKKSLHGYRVSLGTGGNTGNDTQLGYVTMSPQGLLAGVYDLGGMPLGAPEDLLAGARRSLHLLGLVKEEELKDVRVDLSAEVALPGQRDGRGYVLSLYGESIGYVTTTPRGAVSALYDAQGVARGNPWELLVRTRTSLAAVGLVTPTRSKDVRVDFSRKVALPGQENVEGYMAYLDNDVLAYVGPTKKGHSRRVYDIHGVELTDSHHLLSRVSLGLTALGLVSEAKATDIRIDLSTQVEIPRRPELHGYRVLQKEKTIAYVTVAPRGTLKAIYDAHGMARGYPARTLSQTRRGLVELGFVKPGEANRIRVDFAKEVVIPGALSHRRKVDGYPIALDNKTIGYATFSTSGNLSSLYDTEGAAIGHPAQLLSYAKRTLLALGLINAADAPQIGLDLSTPVPIPGPGRKDVYGYAITKGGTPVAYFKKAPGGTAISSIYDTQGALRGDPLGLLTTTRGGLVELGMVTPDESEHVLIDLTAKVSIPSGPGQKSARGYPVSLHDEVLAYINPGRGGRLSAIYNDQGKMWGAPSAFASRVRAGLRFLGVLSQDAKVDIDFLGAAPYAVSSEGNLIAFAHPSAGGNLSRLSNSENGDNWGNPSTLCTNFRWCLRQMEDISLKEIPLLKIDFSAVVSGNVRADLPVRDPAGQTRYYVVLHPKSGYLLKVLDQNKQVLFERKGRMKLSRAGLK